MHVIMKYNNTNSTVTVMTVGASVSVRMSVFYAIENKNMKINWHKT